MDVTPAPPLDPANLPDDRAVLKALVTQLLDSNHALRRQLDQVQHRLQQLLRARFGPKAEKVDPAQLLLFAQEILAETPTPPAAPSEAPAPATPRPGHGRSKLPRHLPRRREVYDVPPEERTCACCGNEMTPIGEEVSEQIEWVPASVIIVEHVRPKYACNHCPDGTVVTAEKPRQPIEKGLPGPGMLAHVITSKYSEHLPLNRQSQMLRRHGLRLCRSTLCGWMKASADLLAPLVERMGDLILESKTLHTDDTPVPVLDAELDRARPGRFWTYRGDDLHPYTLYDYTPTRSRDGPMTFLKDWGHDGTRYLQADAYAGYDGLYRGEAGGQVIEVACWAHARRKAFEAQQSDPARASIALAYIRRLYQVERQARETFDAQAADPQARPLAAIRLEHRQAEALPVLAQLHDWFGEQSGGEHPLLPKSPMATAVGYCLNNWEALCRYAHDGDLDIDNNASERDLRPLVVGRRNWTFLGSDNGGRTAAVLYSLVASAKRHGLDPFAYLRDVLTRLSDLPVSRLEELLPDHWKLAHAAPERQPA